MSTRDGKTSLDLLMGADDDLMRAQAILLTSRCAILAGDGRGGPDPHSLASRECELRSIICRLSNAELDAFIYLGRLYAECNRAPRLETATEIARMQRELREYAEGVGDLPLVPAPAVRH